MSNLRARLARLERQRGKRARPLELWDATEHPAGLFECLAHPGRALTEAELDAHAEAADVDVVLIVYRDAQPDPRPW